jgi:hypothetical protein
VYYFIRERVKGIDKHKLLKSLEVAVKDEKILRSRALNPLTKTLQREALTLFLISAVLEKSYKNRGKDVTFEILENDGVNDGKVYFQDNDENKGRVFEFEQIMLTTKELESKGVDTPIIINKELIKKIKEKTERGYADQEELILTLFSDIKGIATMDEIKVFLREHFCFMFYIYVYLESKDPYVYVVIDLQPARFEHSEFVVTINEDFSEFKVDLNGKRERNIVRLSLAYIKVYIYKVFKFLRDSRGKEKSQNKK